MMGPTDYAPIVEYNDITAGSSATIASGDNFRCRSIILSSETTETAIATISTVVGSETMFRLNIVAGETLVLESPFYADKGMVIAATTNNIHATVLRDHAGT